MSYFQKEFSEARDLLENARRIVIISHRGPDGDTVGANLALKLALSLQWKKEVVSACVDPTPASSQFLPEVGPYVNDFDLSTFDVVMAVDCGAHYMMKFHETKPELLSKKIPLINMDHHASNDHFGTLNIVDAQAAAACQIVYRFLKFCDITITRHIATCLLHGLYYDTGSFMHSNTSPEVLEIAAELMWRGADMKRIVRHQFHSMSIPQLKIYGKILERSRVNSKQMTVSVLNDADFEATASSPEDTTGAIDYLNSVPDANFCCLLYEDRKGFLKGSFRSRVDDIDLSRLAGIFGGGGHKKAAGFSIPGRLLELSPRVKITEE